MTEPCTNPEQPTIQIVVSLPLPKPDLSRLIWQPVTEGQETAMRLRPLSWQPSGAHHALEHLAAERDAAIAAVVREAAIAAGNEIVAIATRNNPDIGPLKLQMLRVAMEKAVKACTPADARAIRETGGGE